MLEHQSANIRQISQNRAEQIGYYRFLGNENVTISELLRSVADQCQQQVEGLHVLSISDSSEVNLQAHRCLRAGGVRLVTHIGTQKQQNPYPPTSLAWATWLVARLGGWSGYRCQRPPGMPTLIHGLRQFEAIFLGWKLAQTPLVCTP